jgi:hypothetical protein
MGVSVGEWVPAWVIGCVGEWVGANRMSGC